MKEIPMGVSPRLLITPYRSYQSYLSSSSSRIGSVRCHGSRIVAPVASPARRLGSRNRNQNIHNMSSSTTIDQKLSALHNFSACDVSDALLKLQSKPANGQSRAGYLADITPLSPYLGRQPSQPKTIAPATTFKFISKDSPVLEVADPKKHGFPSGKHWVDWAQPDTIAVLEQPAGQYCAVLGGIMAARMKYLGVKGVVANGRVRDLSELQESGLHVWAKATSTVGTGAEAKPGERDVPVDFGGVTISPGDIIFCDPLEGVVVIPRDLLDDVLELMPKLVEQDDKVKDEVENGLSVFEAFKKHRSLK